MTGGCPADRHAAAENSSNGSRPHAKTIQSSGSSPASSRNSTRRDSPAEYRALQNRKRSGNVIFFSEDLKQRDKDALSEAVSAEPSAESLLVAADEKQQLLAALAALSLDYREVIVLRELEGLSYEDIAQAMDCPVGTVRSRIFRAREAIDRKLAEVFDGGLGRAEESG